MDKSPQLLLVPSNRWLEMIRKRHGGGGAGAAGVGGDAREDGGAEDEEARKKTMWIEINILWACLFSLVSAALTAPVVKACDPRRS